MRPAIWNSAPSPCTTRITDRFGERIFSNRCPLSTANTSRVDRPPDNPPMFVVGDRESLTTPAEAIKNTLSSTPQDHVPGHLTEPTRPLSAPFFIADEEPLCRRILLRSAPYLISAHKCATRAATRNSLLRAPHQACPRQAAHPAAGHPSTARRLAATRVSPANRTARARGLPLKF